jgi:hypothetical protein
MYADVSSDGVVWTNLFSVVDSTLWGATAPAVTVGAAETTGVASAGFAQFDHFVMNGVGAPPGTTVPPLYSIANLTSGAATTINTITLPTLAMTGGTFAYVIKASDGTNQCAVSGQISYSGENSAGVFVVSPTTGPGYGEPVTPPCTVGSTLTDSWALTAANPALLQVTPTTSMTPTSFTISYYPVLQ